MSKHGLLRGASNEYPQHMFLLRNKKNIDTFWLKKSALSRALINTKYFDKKTKYIQQTFIMLTIKRGEYFSTFPENEAHSVR